MNVFKKLNKQTNFRGPTHKSFGEAVSQDAHLRPSLAETGYNTSRKIGYKSQSLAIPHFLTCQWGATTTWSGLNTHDLSGEETYVHNKPEQAKPPKNPLLESSRFLINEGKQIAKIATQERGNEQRKKKKKPRNTTGFKLQAMS